MSGRISITYFGDDAPIIKCDNLADMERIELIDGEEANWLFLKHGDVSVYHTESHQDMFSENIFSTVRGQERDADWTFDIRDLPAIPEDLLPRFEALYPEDDEKQRCAYAIEAGWITEDGLNRCSACGSFYPEGGDGYDGRCGNCADAHEKNRQQPKQEGEQQ